MLGGREIYCVRLAKYIFLIESKPDAWIVVFSALGKDKHSLKFTKINFSVWFTFHSFSLKVTARS